MTNMIEIQKKLYTILTKDFYKAKELTTLLNTSSNMIKRITKDLKMYKEGYSKNDIIKRIMGGTFYTDEMLENIKFQKLLDNIY